jgi:uncharacterized membrane protein (Fun14 family)
MSTEPLLSSIIPFARSGLLGYVMGFALKKILKWMLFIIGFLAVLCRYLTITKVWDKIGNDSSTQIQHWAQYATMFNSLIFLCSTSMCSFTTSSEISPSSLFIINDNAYTVIRCYMIVI